MRLRKVIVGMLLVGAVLLFLAVNWAVEEESLIRFEDYRAQAAQTWICRCWTI